MDNDRLFKHTFILLLTLSLANIFGLAFHILMGRMLGPAEYGSLAVLFSILYVMNFGNKTIEAVMSRFTSRSSPGEVKGVLIALAPFLVAGCLVFLLLLVVFGGFIVNILHLPSFSVLFTFGVFICVSMIVPVFIGILNGQQRFWWIGVPEAASHGLRILFGVVLVMGLGFWGAILALNISTVIWLGILGVGLWSVLGAKVKKTSLAGGFGRSIPVLFMFGALMIILNIDLLVVKHLFPGITAGNYAAASTLAKIIWFGSAEFVGAAMLPKASRAGSMRLFFKALGLTGVLAGIGAFVMALFPVFLGGLLFGADYSFTVLPILAGAMVFFSLIYTMVMYSIARRDHGQLLLLCAGVLFWIGGVTLFHSSSIEIAVVTFVTNAFTFVLLLSRNLFKLIFFADK